MEHIPNTISWLRAWLLSGLSVAKFAKQCDMDDEKMGRRIYRGIWIIKTSGLIDFDVYNDGGSYKHDVYHIKKFFHKAWIRIIQDYEKQIKKEKLVAIMIDDGSGIEKLHHYPTFYVTQAFAWQIRVGDEFYFGSELDEQPEWFHGSNKKEDDMTPALDMCAKITTRFFNHSGIGFYAHLK